MRDKKESVLEDSKRVKLLKEKALKRSIVEGSAVSAGISMTSSFITPFALAIGANSFHIGLLSSLSGITSPLGQFRGNKLMEKYSRKSLVVISRSLSIFMWLTIIGLAYLSYRGIFEIYLPYALILIYSVLIEFALGIGYVAWFSWMGDIVPQNIRGKYFANRNRITGFFGLVFFLGSAFLLDFFKTKGYVLIGFSVLFFIGAVFRFFSRQLIMRIHNPRFKEKDGYYFSFLDFVKRYDNYGKFAFYQATFYFAVMISSPFFAVYMLEDLGFSYTTFTFVAISSTVFYLIFSSLAGKFSDKYGNVKLLYISAVLFPLVPMLWIFLKNPIALIFFPGLISGIANAAFVIGVTNFTYASVSPQKRGLCLAYTSILIGLGVLFGGLIGGVLIQYLHISFMEPILFAFLLSSLLMIIVSFFFLPKIEEWEKIEKIEGFCIDLHHPLRTITSDFKWLRNFIYNSS